MVTPELLRQYAHFARLGPESLQKLASIADEQNVAAGQTIFAESDPAEYLYLIVRGEVNLACELGNGELRVVDTGPARGRSAARFLQYGSRLGKATADAGRTDALQPPEQRPRATGDGVNVADFELQPDRQLAPVEAVLSAVLICLSYNAPRGESRSWSTSP
jgi:CRP-like cAMP-binding protein